MTASSSSNQESLQTSTPTFGVQNYVTMLRSQLELTTQLTTAWASAVSAVSSRMLALSPTVAHSAEGTADQTAAGGWSTGFPGLRSVRDVGGADASTTEPSSADFGWGRSGLSRPATGGMLRWLTAPPTLQTNLFDETIELLLDEDIKTAS